MDVACRRTMVPLAPMEHVSCATLGLHPSMLAAVRYHFYLVQGEFLCLDSGPNPILQ